MIPNLAWVSLIFTYVVGNSGGSSTSLGIPQHWALWTKLVLKYWLFCCSRECAVLRRTPQKPLQHRELAWHTSENFVSRHSWCGKGHPEGGKIENSLDLVTAHSSKEKIVHSHTFCLLPWRETCHSLANKQFWNASQRGRWPFLPIQLFPFQAGTKPISEITWPDYSLPSSTSALTDAWSGSAETVWPSSRQVLLICLKWAQVIESY